MHLLVPVSLLLVVTGGVASIWRSSHRLHRRFLLLRELGLLPSLWLGEILIVLVDLPPLIVAKTTTTGALTHLLLLVLLLDALLGLALHVGQVVLHGLAQGATPATLDSLSHGSRALDATR